jgi:hypothetical protein
VSLEEAVRASSLFITAHSTRLLWFFVHSGRQPGVRWRSAIAGGKSPG